MNGLKKEKKVFGKFNKTASGASKFALFIMGIILGLTSSTLFGYMCGSYNATGNYRYYDWLLFVAIFLLILTGELIGIYFGAYEEYVLNKKDNEKLIEEENNLHIEEKKEERVINKENKSRVNKKNTKKTAVKKVNNVTTKGKKDNKTVKKTTNKRKTKE